MCNPWYIEKEKRERERETRETVTVRVVTLSPFRQGGEEDGTRECRVEWPRNSYLPLWCVGVCGREFTPLVHGMTRAKGVRRV